MNYSDAIVYLKEHNITKDDGTFYEFGDVCWTKNLNQLIITLIGSFNRLIKDIPEAPERKMTDQINEPILLCRFPAEIKSFYMKRDPKDTKLTESVDLLMPNVGEIVGGSMRNDDYESLVESFKKNGISPDPYYWYLDQVGWLID